MKLLAGGDDSEVTESISACIGRVRRLRVHQKTSTTTKARPIMPPITPPAISPVLDECEPELEPEGVGTEVVVMAVVVD